MILLYVESIVALTSDHNPVILILHYSSASTAIKVNSGADNDCKTYKVISIPGIINPT